MSASYNPLKEEQLKTLNRMAKLQANASSANPRKRARSQSTQSFLDMAAETTVVPGTPSSVVGSPMSRTSSDTSLASLAPSSVAGDVLPLGLSVKSAIEHLDTHRRAWTREELLAQLDRLDPRALDELKQNPKVEYDSINDVYSYRAKFVGINNAENLLQLLKRPENDNGIPFDQLKDSYKGVDADIRRLHEKRQVLLVTIMTSKSAASTAAARAMAAAYPNVPTEIAERLYSPQTTPSSNVIVYYNSHAIKAEEDIKMLWHQLTKEVPSDPNDLSEVMRRARLKETEVLDLRTQHLLDEQLRQQALQKRPKVAKVRKLTNVHLKDQFDFSTANPDT